MDKTITFSLSQDSVKKAIAELEKYKNSINDKCEELCRRLCEAGIDIANSYIDDNSSFGRYIHLSSEITSEKAGCKAMFYMGDFQQITSRWITKEGTRTATVSPSLMLEFGSGTRAQNPAGIEGMGQGTFPEQTHAYEKGWWYLDANDKQWHYSSGHTARLPMYHAGQEIRDKVIDVVKEVFG